MTELPQNRYKKKRSHTKPRPGNNKPLDMSNTKVKYCIETKGTRNHQLQTDQYLQTTPIDVQSVEILPTMKDSHAQLRNTNARHVISLDTLPANVSKENNAHSTNTDGLKHIKFRLTKYMTAQTVTHQMLAPVKIPSVCR